MACVHAGRGLLFLLLTKGFYIVASGPSLRAKESRPDSLEQAQTLASGDTLLGGRDYWVPLLDPGRVPFGGLQGADVLSNWGEQEYSRGVNKHHPGTYEEVASIVREASGRRVRVLGATLSFSKLLPDDDSEVIFLDHFRTISQDPHDYTVVTLQAGVTVAELADWADSPDRTVGRFSYLPQNVLVQAATFVGAAQTGSHGSGWSPPTPDYITRATFVTAKGTIEVMDRSHPDFAVLVMSVGMVGILLDVTVKVGQRRRHQEEADFMDSLAVKEFDPSTSGAAVLEERRPMRSLIPLPGTLINDTYNPLRDWIQGHSTGTLTYIPFNSAFCQSESATIDKSKLWEYYWHDSVWTFSADYRPDVKVKETREGMHPLIGSQQEPYYDKDLVVPLDYVPLPTRGARLAFKHMAKLFAAPLWALAYAAAPYFEPPALYPFNLTFNTSRAFSQHFTRYLQNLPPGADYSFGLRHRLDIITFVVCWEQADPDFANVYQAWWAMLELNAEHYRAQPSPQPLIIFAAIRWVTGSKSPLSAAYGDPSATYVFFEQASLAGTPAWPAYATAFLQRMYSIRSKVDNSLPKPHWGKTNWATGLVDYIKTAMPEQLSMVREVVQRRDPQGIFRNQWLSTVFDLLHRE